MGKSPSGDLKESQRLSNKSPRHSGQLAKGLKIVTCPVRPVCRGMGRGLPARFPRSRGSPDASMFQAQNVFLLAPYARPRGAPGTFGGGSCSRFLILRASPILPLSAMRWWASARSLAWARAILGESVLWCRKRRRGASLRRGAPPSHRMNSRKSPPSFQKVCSSPILVRLTVWGEPCRHQTPRGSCCFLKLLVSSPLE